MTGPNQDVASLLLRVAVDYDSLGDFLDTLPAIPEVIQAVGDRINQTQMGSAPVFAKKGAALTRAFVTGLQSEALGLNFGSVTDQITRQVFGRLDTGQIDRYRQHVRDLYAEIKQSVPIASRPLFDPSSFQGLGQLTGGAANARREVTALTDQLATLRGELAAIQNITLPKTLVRRSTSGELEYAPQARQALERTGAFRERPLPQPLDFSGPPASGGRASVAGTNRNIAEFLKSELENYKGFLTSSAIPNTQAVINAVGAADRAVTTNDPMELVGRALAPVRNAARDTAAALDRVTDAALRLERTQDEQARRPRQVLDTVTAAGELFSKTEVAIQARQTRGQTDIFEAVAETPKALAPLISNLPAERVLTSRTAAFVKQLGAEGTTTLFRGDTEGLGTGDLHRQQRQKFSDEDGRFFTTKPVSALTYAALENPAFGIGGPTGRLSALDVPTGALAALSPTGGGGSGVYRLPGALAAQARTIIEGTNQQLREYQAILQGGVAVGSSRPQLPVGVGNGPASAVDQRRLEQLEDERNVRRFRQVDLLERQGRLEEISFNERGYASGYTDTRDLPQVSQAEALRFMRQQNEDTLRALDVRGQLQGATANTPEVDAEALGGIIGGRALDSLLAGRGISVAAQRKLTEEQQEALGSTNAGGLNQTLLPFDLLTVEDARRELLAGSEDFVPAPRPLNASLAQIRRGEQQLNAANERSRQRAEEVERQAAVQQESRRLASQREADRRTQERAIAETGRPLRRRLTPEQLDARDLARAEQREAAVPPPRGSRLSFINDDALASTPFNQGRGLPSGTRRGELVERTVPASELGSRVSANTIPDGRGGGLIRFSDTPSPNLTAEFIRLHELQHVAPRRNPIRFHERVQNPFSLGSEEARADALAGRNLAVSRYPNRTGDPAFQQGYDFVHARISEGLAYREKTRREEELLAGNSAGGIPGAPQFSNRPLPVVDQEAIRAGTIARLETNIARLAQGGAEPALLADFQRRLALELQAQARAATAATTGTQLTTEAEQRLGAADRALAAARVAATRQTATEPGLAGARARALLAATGVASQTPITVGDRFLPASTITDAENARRRRALQDSSRAAGEESFDRRRAREQGVGDDQQRGTRPGSSFGQPQPETGDARFRRQQAERAFEGDIFDRFGNPVGGGRGGGRGGPQGPPPPGGFPPFGGAGGPPVPPPEGGGFGAVGAFFGGVRRGAFGSGENTPDFLGRAAGSALRFSLVYGAAYSALSLLTGGFSQAVQETIGFETALTNLNIATERTGRSNEAFAQSLVNLGAGRGVGPGEAVEAGARAIGLFDATDSSRKDQEAIARQSVDTATRLAFLAPGVKVEQIQTQVAGISRSFGVEPLEQERVADVASFIGRRTGRPGAEILASLGQIGSLGENAGFSLEQVAAIIARLTSTTGQTPQAVSGFLSQVLSRADDPRLKETLRGVGVETTGTTLAQQIEQLSTLDLSTGQTNQIVSGFGRGRSGQALGIILEQFPEIQALAGGARNESAGLAEKDFQQAVNTVGGTLRTLSAETKDLFVGIASSGLLDPLVALLSGIGQLVNALDFLVDGFNQIPREARTAAFALAGVFAALALFSRIGPGVALAARATGGALGTTDVLATRRFGRNKGDAIFDEVTDEDGNKRRVRRTRTEFIGSNSERATAVAAGLGGAAVGSASRGLTALGGTAAGAAAANLIPGLAAGGIAAGAVVLGAGAVLAGAIIGVALKIGEAGDVQDTLTEAGIALNTASTPEEFDAAINLAKVAKKDAEERDDFKFFSADSLSFGLFNAVDEFTNNSREQRAEAEADILRGEKDRKESQERDKTVDPFTVLGGFASTDGVSNGLKELTERGFTAAQQLDVLNGAFDALLSTTGPAGASAVLLKGQGPEFGRVVTEKLLEDFDASLKELQTARTEDGANGIGGGLADFFNSVPNATSPIRQGFTGALSALRSNDVEKERERLRGEIEKAKPGSQEKVKLEGELEKIRFKDEASIFTRGDDAAKAFAGGAGEAIQEFFLPFQSDREQREENSELASDLRKKLSKPEAREQLNQGVLDVLNEQGLNPTDGPQPLGPEDVTAIRDRQREILLDLGGDSFKDLPKKEQDARVDAITESVRQSVEGFAGVDVTAANGRAYLDSVRGLAAKAGQDKALTSGSELQGAQATVDIFLGGRSKIDESIGKIDKELNATGLDSEGKDKAPTDERRKQLTIDREKQVQLLAQLGLETDAAIKARTAAARQDIQSIVELDKSLLKEGDVQGAIAADLAGIADQLALPKLTDLDKRGLEAQRNKLLQQAAKESRQATGQQALNRRDPDDEFGRLDDQLKNQRIEVDSLEQGSLARGQAEDQLIQLQEKRSDALLQYFGQVALNRINPRNQFARLNQAKSNLQAEINALPPGNEREGLIDQLNQLRAQGDEYVLANSAAVRLANNNPNNALANALDEEANALDRQRDAQRTRDPLSINTADGDVRRAGAARRAQEIERSSAVNSFRNTTDPGSGIQRAAETLFDAQADLERYDKDSAEYYRALQRIRGAQIGLADAQRDFAQQVRRNGTDITNPLENARSDLADITDDLNAARARNAAPDTIAALEGQQRQATVSLERTAFDQRMADFRTRNQLGEISDAAYLDYLNSEKARLEAISGRTFQQQGFLNDVNQALLGLNDQLQGQFNLGDITVPSPFQVRQQLIGGVGAQTTSNVQNVQVVVNGGDLNEVKAVMAQYLGASAFGRTSLSTQKI